VVNNFLTQDACEELKKECDNIIESNHFVEEINKISVFDASANDDAARVLFLFCFFLFQSWLRTISLMQPKPKILSLDFKANKRCFSFLNIIPKRERMSIF
jgi:hypothetical protein